MCNYRVTQFPSQELFFCCFKKLDTVISLRDQFEEGAVDTCIIGEFRMEGRGHDIALAHRHRVVVFLGDYFNSPAHALDFGSPNEDHLRGRSGENALADTAIDLPAVGVAANADIESAQPRLLGVFD